MMPQIVSNSEERSANLRDPAESATVRTAVGDRHILNEASTSAIRGSGSASRPRNDNPEVSCGGLQGGVAVGVLSQSSVPEALRGRKSDGAPTRSRCTRCSYRPPRGATR